jgi:HTH-type transcriptional regulator/antitoxin HipB
MNPIRTPAQIGTAFRSRRKHLKLSQATVASQLGVSQSRLSQLESNPEVLTVAQMLTLMSILGLQLNVDKSRGTPSTKVEW